MPSSDQNTFMLKWSADRHSLYVKRSGVRNQWMMINHVHIGALEGTEWAIYFCPRTENEHIACIFQRNPIVDEEREISFEYFVSILGKDGLVLYAAEGVVNDICPKDQIQLDIVETDELPPYYFANDQLCIVCEIRHVRSGVPANIGSVKWEDEMRVLSEDMRRLLETGYLSDVRLVASDGSFFFAHWCVLLARWKQLYDAHQNQPSRPRSIHVTEATGPLLKKFLTYLYTGKIRASDVTTELFEFVVTRSRTRERFYTLPQEMRTMTDHQKEHVGFTWYAEDSSVDLYRVLPVAIIGELFVEMRSAEADQSYLVVKFSPSMLPSNYGWVQLHCTATVVRHDDRYSESADHIFQDTLTPWFFPHFLQQSDGCGRIRIKFELTVITGPISSCVESTVTEFDTGSLEVRRVELLSSEMWSAFQATSILNLWDVKLNTEGGVIPVSKAIICIRSEVFRNLFYGNEDSAVSFYILHSDPNTLSSVLGYLYTGWTRIMSVGEALKIGTLARRLSMHGLEKKCEQYLSGSYFSNVAARFF